MTDERKKAWEMTPEEFGRAFSPHRIYGRNGVRFFYKAVDDSARPMTHATRDEAVRAAHRHVVAAALSAGVAVPPGVLALYPDLLSGEPLPDLADLAGPARNEASDEPLRKARASMELAERAICAISGTTRAIAAMAEQIGEQRALSVTVATGLVKALHHEAEKSRGMAEAMREGAEDRAEAIERLNAALAVIKKQAARMATSKTPPAGPRKWTFTVRRDAHGNIAGMDATSC